MQPNFPGGNTALGTCCQQGTCRIPQGSTALLDIREHLLLCPGVSPYHWTGLLSFVLAIVLVGLGRWNKGRKEERITLALLLPPILPDFNLPPPLPISALFLPIPSMFSNYPAGERVRRNQHHHFPWHCFLIPHSPYWAALSGLTPNSGPTPDTGTRGWPSITSITRPVVGMLVVDELVKRS